MSTTTSAGTTDNLSFSHLLRERSWALHEQAETAGFIQRLMAGEVDQTGYAAMVAQHYVIYSAIEEVAETLATDPLAGTFITSDLNRLDRLKQDLAFLYGPQWESTIEALPATLRYAERVRGVADWPGGFVAHHYTRYLGDLSGGLAIGRIVARTYGFEAGGDGVRFYDFSQIEKPKIFKDRYREALDAAPWTPAERDRVIDEVLYAYQLNTEVFTDLGATPAGAAR